MKHSQELASHLSGPGNFWTMDNSLAPVNLVDFAQLCRLHTRYAVRNLVTIWVACLGNVRY